MQDLLRDGQSSLSHFPPPVGWRMQNRVRERRERHRYRTTGNVQRVSVESSVDY